jgi:ribonuclease D
VHYEYIDTPQELDAFCRSIADAPTIAFDTEFVSEDTYRPELCLIQVAAGGQLAIIDPLALDDVTPFWELLVTPGHETVVHAGRHEFVFCQEAVGTRPTGWFDIQLAAAFVGLEFPAAYSTLISKLLGRTVPKAETRSNWRRRPLSERQLDYSLQDVLYLEPIRDALVGQIEDLQRRTWLDEELQAWQREVESAGQRDPWRRVSGIAGLNRRQLAIVRGLWQWRENEARERNCPPRRVLRDDLIVELARRQTHSVNRIRAIRGMERRNHQKHLPALSETIRQACKLDDADCPPTGRRSQTNSPPLNLLSQFLAAALSSLCRSMQLAPSLVGTSQDLRDFVAHRFELVRSSENAPPALAKGWRAEVVGRVLDDLLDGKLSVRVDDPMADNPLRFETADVNA